MFQILKVNKKDYDNKDLFLRNKSRKLTRSEIESPAFRDFIQEMFDTLYSCGTGVGLAAPQVGIMQRVAVVDEKKDASNPLVLINPTYTPIGDEMVESPEGCLSFPGITVFVKRYKKVRVTSRDVNFNPISFDADGFLAIVCQHEIDHLNGEVFIDKAFAKFDNDAHYSKMTQQAIDRIFSTNEDAPRTGEESKDD